MIDRLSQVKQSRYHDTYKVKRPPLLRSSSSASPNHEITFISTKHFDRPRNTCPRQNRAGKSVRKSNACLYDLSSLLNAATRAKDNREGQ